jgi:hypothetical protein
VLQSRFREGYLSVVDEIKNNGKRKSIILLTCENNKKTAYFMTLPEESSFRNCLIRNQ